MNRDQFIDWIVGKIAGEMSGARRAKYAVALAEIAGLDRVQLLKSVEDKTKAKDKGTLLAFVEGL